MNYGGIKRRPGRSGEIDSMKNSYWKDKRVLITGYEGFLGSNLTKALLGFKARVWGLDIETRRHDTILKDDFGKMKIIRGSVEDYNLLLRIIKTNKIEIIFHLAATSLVGEALKKPFQSFSTNIRGTWNILEAARNSKSVKTIIVASSDKAYGIQKKLPYRENSPLIGVHPYDVSKSCADLIAYTYFHTYGLPVSVTRCGNIFGPGDFNFSRIVPDAIRSIVFNKKLLIRSDGKFIRDYIYVDDIVSGYLKIAESMKKKKLAGEAFNFSNEFPISVLQLVKMIYKACGRSPNYRILNQARYEIKEQYLCAGKARRILGWEPKYSLDKGLKLTLDWYKEYLKTK